jgi:hypothetical protein
MCPAKYRDHERWTAAQIQLRSPPSRLRAAA